MTTGARATISVQGVALEIVERGTGRPLLFLHGSNEVGADATFIGALAEHFRVIVPSHPGFGHSSLPDSFDSVDDLAFFYLDLLDQLDLHDVVLAGASFGGWIAAEIAVRSCHRLSSLILADPIGIKVGGRETREIADPFALPAARLNLLMYHNPALGETDLRSLAEDELTVIARNRQSLALFTWQPFAHNPKLRGRLHRISVPTLVLWGESDGIVTPAYGAAYRDAIPRAQLQIIPQAGHLPHIEQPAAFVEQVLRFTASA